MYIGYDSHEVRCIDADIFIYKLLLEWKGVYSLLAHYLP